MKDATSGELLDRLYQATKTSSDAALATALGLSHQAVYSAKSKQKIPTSWVYEAAKRFGISADWIFFGRGAMLPSENAEVSPSPLVDASTCVCDVDLIMIPRVAARLAAGTGSLETEGDVVGMYAFRSDWIVRKGNTDRMVLMDVIGDSMMPEIKHGDMVLIDQSKTNILGYGYFAVGIDEAVYVKQLRPKPGKLILHSLNPDYDDIEVDMAAEQPQDVRIIGRVLWVGRELD